MLILFSTIIGPIIVGVVLGLFKHWLDNRQN
ncbi:type I toxin-antitoxin system Fst family toxin [Enterococcus ureasiticus]|nr:MULTISPECIES: type I toxin-antitoxin system Fst family toxin [Enterococcus]MBO0434395.1 type I toxin-antitoxin system Fst family toxin [Enterococcus sp. DIV0849a]MBO0474060.1 type I toxin-antitoxin system Fst family toxin [Enterococcus ureasiticus]